MTTSVILSIIGTLWIVLLVYTTLEANGQWPYVTRKRFNEVYLQLQKLEVKLAVAKLELDKALRDAKLHAALHKAWQATSSPSVQFTSEELRTLRRLCHPDRHDGSKASNEITKKLNGMIK